MQDNSFEDKVVFVTGGSRGIGFETVRLFYEKGAKVAFCSQKRENVRKALAAFSQKERILGECIDVRDYKALDSFIDRIIKRFGGLDILVNNAGVLWHGDFWEEEKSSIDFLIDVNIKGVLYATRIALPHMLVRRKGVIVNIASGAGKHGHPTLTTYSATKFAVVGFSESLAQELEGAGVLVFCICPGPVATDMQVLVSGQKIGMAPSFVAEKIVEVSGPNPPIPPGSCLDLF
jgi:NAD(P)-dependent dehydrogenase (short-subunit alcohol dehydrogenase family)